MSVVRPVVRSVVRPVVQGVFGGSSDAAAPDPVALVAGGYWLAERLSSQTAQVGGGVPAATDRVATVSNIAATPVFNQFTKFTTNGPILTADGTSYYWSMAASVYFTCTRTAAAATVDIFMVIRSSATSGTIFYDGDESAYVGWFEVAGPTFALTANSGSPVITVNSGSTITTPAGLRTAAVTGNWVRVRFASVSLASWTNFAMSYPNVDVAALAIVTSSVVATGSNLTDINTQLDALITKLNA